MQYRESLMHLKLLCRVVTGKEWDQASEAEQEKCRLVAKEIHAITYRQWPTHVSEKTKH
ncbi:hypothetical protein [Chelativorans sp.]|uniref:hypothetical protein n=1 Tax=Chelativorans sp. TaxID=2203393 RepID=UPI0028125074|nr:hypothetical protein [Chelativorans sp.]